MTADAPAPRADRQAASVSRQVADERRRAIRTLLQRPLIAGGGAHAVEFGLVRRHADWLRDWFTRHPGWTLVVDSEMARLHKVPPTAEDGTRCARDPKNGAPFTRRCYVLLCLALAVLERADRQTTLGRLADEVAKLAAADDALAQAGIVFDMSAPDQRRDLVRAVRLLLDLRVLARVHGEEQQFLSGKGDVLYGVSRSILARVVSLRRGPSTIQSATTQARLDALLDETFPDSDEGRNRRLRTRVTRRLLDDPVVCYDELPDDERAYLSGQRALLLRQIGDATGLHAEVRAEGIALADEDGELSDLGLPEEGTEGHLTLLLAEYLAARLRASPARAVGWAALHAETAALVAEHCHRRGHWRKDVGASGAEVRLVEETMERLAGLRLVRRTPEGVVPRPAIARYAVGNVTTRGLFDDVIAREERT